MSFLSKDVGIDLGTANTLVYMKGKGIIMREPSVVAVDTKTDEVRCVGGEAKAVIGRTPGSIVAVRPLKDGVIADFDITANMLENFLKKACGNSMFSRPRVVICIPSGVTEVERRAVREATLKAGARQVSVIEEPMAAAIGAGLPISEPTGSMIVDIGGGTAEIAVISLGGIVASRSVRMDVRGIEFASSDSHGSLAIPCESNEHNWDGQHMAVLWMIVIVWSVKVCRHYGNIIGSVLTV